MTNRPIHPTGLLMLGHYRTRASVVPLLLAVSVGCGGQIATFSKVGSAVGGSGPVTTTAAAPPNRQAAEPAGPAAGGKPAAANGPAGSDIERRIIFSGQLEVVVKDFEVARGQLTRLVEEAQGYFAKSEVTQGAGSRRTGVFTVKVPAARFQPTIDALSKFGVAVRNSTDSQDVTEEFVDVQARVRNLKAEEETFNRLLKDAAGRLDDVFKIREQIRQVRGDIERAEGRLKLLTALSALSMIQVTLREEADYVPPTAEPPAPPPAFAGRVAGTFAGSVGVLRQVGEAVVIGLTAAAPWLPLVLVAALALRRLGRRLQRPGLPGTAAGVTPEDVS